MRDVGFYGKLPSHGDFLHRRVSEAFVCAWDAWLQECLAASRAALHERWLDVYLTSPAWRFACAGGTCGPASVIGVMVPSIDRVGRYFPLTVVTALPTNASLIGEVTQAAAFFEQAERVAVETLAAEPVDFARFDERVLGLGEILATRDGPPTVALDASAAVMFDRGPDVCWHIPIASPDHLAPMFEQLLAHRLSAIYDPIALWWTEGSSNVEPSCLIAKGLPPPQMFGALLDGTWAQHGWRSLQAQACN